MPALKDMKQTNDIRVGDYVNIPCLITAINEVTGVLTLITQNPKGTETTISTLLNTQVEKD